jgi:hypothetical protein
VVIIEHGRAGVAATILLLVLPLAGCGGPPQIGADRETFQTVDALYTAVGLRDAARVEQTGAKLKSLRDAGKIPERAYRSLELVIAESRERKWEPALDRLTRFMEGQRQPARGVVP